MCGKEEVKDTNHTLNTLFITLYESRIVQRSCTRTTATNNINLYATTPSSYS